MNDNKKAIVWFAIILTVGFLIGVWYKNLAATKQEKQISNLYNFYKEKEEQDRKMMEEIKLESEIIYLDSLMKTLK